MKTTRDITDWLPISRKEAEKRGWDRLFGPGTLHWLSDMRRRLSFRGPSAQSRNRQDCQVRWVYGPSGTRPLACLCPQVPYGRLEFMVNKSYRFKFNVAAIKKKVEELPPELENSLKGDPIKAVGLCEYVSSSGSLSSIRTGLARNRFMTLESMFC